jgi:hypothetical protein|tara:strand:+ start:544 stop:678 length:135 start_codon:yes stop_codon:yes gene_type:complete
MLSPPVVGIVEVHPLFADETMGEFSKLYTTLVGKVGAVEFDVDL